MSRILLDDLSAFSQVAKHQSFTSAARSLRISPSALSQKIRALEARFGTTLFTRTTRSVALTDTGRALFERVEPAVQELLRAYEDIGNEGEPVGTLRLHVPRGVIPTFIEPVLAGFCEKYPKLQVEIFAEDNVTDLVASGFDAGVRQGELVDANMTTLQIMPPFRLIVVGSPSYLRRAGRPQRAAELSAHNCICTRLRKDIIMRWQLIEGGRVIEFLPRGQVVLNDYALSVSSARAGLGLAYVAEHSVEEFLLSGELEAVMIDHAPVSSGVFLFYPAKRSMPGRLACFIDYISQPGAPSHLKTPTIGVGTVE